MFFLSYQFQHTLGSCSQRIDKLYMYCRNIMPGLGGFGLFWTHWAGKRRTDVCMGRIHSDNLAYDEFQSRKLAISASCYPGIRSFCQQLVGSTIFTNVRRHRDLDFHFVFNSRVDIYTPSSTIKDGEYRVVEIGILRSGRKYQQKLMINFTGRG